MRNNAAKTTTELYHQELSVKNNSKTDYDELKQKLVHIFPHINVLLDDENFVFRI